MAWVFIVVTWCYRKKKYSLMLIKNGKQIFFRTTVIVIETIVVGFHSGKK